MEDLKGGDIMDENSLTHYGVLGMKWGRRKQKSSGSSNRTSRREEKKVVKEAKKRGIVSSVKKTKKVKIKDLSDSELQSKIRRLQMEKQYRDLKRDEVSKGRKMAGQILSNVGVKLGTEVLYNASGILINKATKKNLVNVKDDKKKERA